MTGSIGYYTGAVNGLITGTAAALGRLSYRTMESPLLQRIEARLEATGQSASGASRAAGLSEDAIRNLRRSAAQGRNAGVNSRTLSALAPVLRTSVEWLTDGAGPEEVEPTDQLRPGGANGNRRAAIQEVEPVAAFNLSSVQAAMPQNMPVFGTAAGSMAVRHEGAFELESRVVEYVRRPPALTSVSDAYAFYVTGGSMAPEHKPGDLRFVHPHKPARVGDSVVIQAQYAEHLGVEAFIAHFVRRTADHVVVAKLVPAAEVRFEARYVQAVHRVLTMNELFGV